MKQAFVAFLIVGFLFTGSQLFAHPGSGIAVDRQGNVYFIDTGSGVWKIDREGKLTKLSAPAFHWMTMDVDGKLGSVTLPHFSPDDATVARDAGDPRILVSSDFPIAVGPDGSLYYPWSGDDEQLRI